MTAFEIVRRPVNGQNTLKVGLPPVKALPNNMTEIIFLQYKGDIYFQDKENPFVKTLTENESQKGLVKDTANGTYKFSIDSSGHNPYEMKIDPNATSTTAHFRFEPGGLRVVNKIIEPEANENQTITFTVENDDVFYFQDGETPREIHINARRKGTNDPFVTVAILRASDSDRQWLWSTCRFAVGEATKEIQAVWHPAAPSPPKLTPEGKMSTINKEEVGGSNGDVDAEPPPPPP